MKEKKLLSQIHPVLYFLVVWLKRLKRYREWYFGSKKYSKNKSSHKLSHRVKRHKSILLRKLGDIDIQLQINKVTNLKIASNKINGIIIKTGETFSFC